MNIFRKSPKPASVSGTPAQTDPIFDFPQVQPVYTAHFYYHGGGKDAPVLHKQSGVQMTAQGDPDQVISFLNRTQPALGAEYGWPMGEYDYAVLIDPPHVAYPH